MTKIAIFLSTSGHSGVDRAMKQLIPELARRGYAVDLLKVRKHGPYLDTPIDNVRVIDLGSRHTYFCLLGLIRYFRTEKPAAILSDKDRVNRTALLARFLSKHPCRQIVRFGTTLSIDLESRGFLERQIQKNSIRWLYPFADKLIVSSQGVADDATAYTGLAPRYIEVVPSPVIEDSLLDMLLPTPKHPWFQEKKIPIIISVGELSKRKDFSTLIQAFALLRQQYPCRLMIIGRGKQQAALEQQIQTLGLGEVIELAGFIDKPYAYLQHADLFAFTSRWEGLGFVLIEALAMGTPVVSTSCPHGPEEILQGGRYGALVPVGDVAELAKQMAQALKSPPTPDSLKQAVKPYTVSAAADAYLNVLGLPAYATEREHAEDH